MSLKAKLEAVIYAAEEPVTLAQLAELFAGEALLWKAEQQANALNALTQPTAEALEHGSPQAELAGLDEIPDGNDDDTNAADDEARLRQAKKRQDREVREILRAALDELIAQYRGDERGIEIREIAGGYRLATKPECHDAVRAFVKSLKPALKLSLPALETLAVIAYKQPVTAPEVAEIRGVDSAGVLGSLISRKLIATAGRKQVVGRPMLYKTTREFLLRFGLKDISELPSMEEFEKMAALELSDTLSDSDEASDSERGNETGDLFDHTETGAAQSAAQAAASEAMESDADQPVADNTPEAEQVENSFQ
uniref:Condensin subunit ScpB n=1 Tax=mine drainage metagenome TaxID=410659 RepID=E6PY36_9ZZZZ